MAPYVTILFQLKLFDCSAQNSSFHLPLPQKKNKKKKAIEWSTLEYTSKN